MTIDEAVARCRATGLVGWPLVQHARQLVAETMAYSYTASFDRPSVAFARGRGYCWQQAKALLLVLRRLGLRCRLVYATRNDFPPTVHLGRPVPRRISGHVWCRVTVDGEERDVCPGDPGGAPGDLAFTPLSRVRRWNAAIAAGSYLGSAVTNRRRYRALLATAPLSDPPQTPDEPAGR